MSDLDNEVIKALKELQESQKEWLAKRQSPFAILGIVKDYAWIPFVFYFAVKFYLETLALHEARRELVASQQRQHERLDRFDRDISKRVEFLEYRDKQKP